MASATLVAFADLPFIFIFLIVLYLIGEFPLCCSRHYCYIGDHNRLAVQPIIKRMSASASSDGKTKQSVLVEMLSGLETLKSLKRCFTS